ncbi:hypothetical protein FACS18948_2590 [Clostridia bacterium]|nr:hypothetical protein FACS18948_2590 [Clostridia bacterium]
MAVTTQIIYADKNIVVANKPKGVGVASNDSSNSNGLSGDHSLERSLTEQYGAAYPVHRLDVMTGGLVLFARSEMIRDYILSQIAADTNDAVKGIRNVKRLEKTYRATVIGTPCPPVGTWRCFIRKDTTRSRVDVFDKPVPNGRLAISTYNVVDADTPELSIVEVTLLTGRTHQIRAQAAYFGTPILGDDLYGNRAMNKRFKAKSQMLEAFRLRMNLGGALSYLDGKVFTI